MAKPEVKTNEATNACDLRDWLDGVQSLGTIGAISPAPIGTWRSER